MDANKIGKTFKLTKKLGSGAFGEIFLYLFIIISVLVSLPISFLLRVLSIYIF